MYDLSIEKHFLKSRPVSYRLVQDIYSHSPQGKIVVVARNPATLLASTHKQGLKLIHRTRRERANTHDSKKIAELSRQLAWMQSLRFSACLPEDTLEADITFATAEDLVRVPPVCQCMYVTYTFEREKLYMLTAWMPQGGQVVIYGQR